MFQHSNPLLLRTGLIVATMLAIGPTQLHAQTTPVPGQGLSSSTPALTPTQPNLQNSAKAITTDNVSQTGAKTKPGEELQPSATGTKPSTPTAPASTATTPLAPATTATGTTPTTGTQKKPASAVSTNSPPVMDTVNLVLNLKEKQVYVYKGDKVLSKYPVAIGKKGWETPVGEWYVMEKITNPGWTSFKDGKTKIKPGANNPLGERWIGFWTDGQDVIGFHGTPNPESIGKAVSHGCVRMHNRDVKALFPLVKVGTTVKVVAQ
jgi:lipoprotein-anchoring transpeptidase ErfK/SrfK